MGLDVYLYRYEVPLAEYRQRAEVASALDDKLRDQAAKESGMPWKTAEDLDWDKATGAQKKAYWTRQGELRAENGLDEYGEPALKEKIELPSAIHPEHYFKIGYFRSSYNAGGINRILGNMGLADLSDLFPVPKGDDDYTRAVNWPASLALSKELRDKYAARKADLGGVTVTSAAHNIFGGSNLPESEAAALKIYEDEKAKHAASAGGFGDYGNSRGEWLWKHPFKAVAMIPGKSILGAPCVYLVGEYATADDDKDDGDYYAKALDIVVETCEWVLAQPKPESFLLHWSG